MDAAEAAASAVSSSARTNTVQETATQVSNTMVQPRWSWPFIVPIPPIKANLEAVEEEPGNDKELQNILQQ